MAYVLVKNGMYRNKPVQGVVFKLTKDLHRGSGGKNCIRVDGSESAGYPDKEIAIFVSGKDAYDPAEKPKAHGEARTDEQIREHIGTVFEFMGVLVEGAAEGKVRSTIISGGAGVGKSYGTERILREYSVCDRLAWDEDDDDDEENVRRTEVVQGEKKFQPKYSILKGATSAVILYAHLHKYSNPGEVLVLDDCDSIFSDIDSLNILKAALDTGQRRILTYSKDSHVLKERGVPQKFEYKGSVVFITNVDFESFVENRPGSSLTPHLKALMSRTHYLDMGLHTHRERLLQVEIVQEESGFLYNYCGDADGVNEVVQFMKDNSYKLREVSLRSAISIAEKRALSPNKWRRMVQMMEFRKEYRGC